LKKYEGMFLLDPAITTDWENVETELGRLMDRAGARTILSTKWDERRLAYEIKGRKQAIYALTYFEADPTKITGLERDVQISESVLRCLVVSAEHLSEEEMKEIAARPASQPMAEGDRFDRFDRGRRYDERGDRGGSRPPQGGTSKPPQRETSDAGKSGDDKAADKPADKAADTPAVKVVDTSADKTDVAAAGSDQPDTKK